MLFKMFKGIIRFACPSSTHCHSLLSSRVIYIALFFSDELGFIAGPQSGARPYPAAALELKSQRSREASLRPEGVDLGGTLWIASWRSRSKLGADAGL